LRLSVLGAESEEAKAEAGGKERGGEEGGAGTEEEDDEEVEEEEVEEARGRQWTAMADMLLVYWCCWVLLGGDGLPLRSASDGGGATVWGGGDIDISYVDKTSRRAIQLIQLYECKGSSVMASTASRFYSPEGMGWLMPAHPTTGGVVTLASACLLCRPDE